MKRSAEIFERVVGLDLDARAPFLDRACGPDAELRADVEALLEAHDACGAFLDEPTHSDRASGRRTADDNDPLPGDPCAASPGVIGRYKLLEHLGEGGFGTVWMAEQRDPVKRRVAVKIIKRGMDSRQVIARFEAERQALALMDHPNIARILDGGSTDSGEPYFVMEYIRGVPILKHCDTERLDTRARLKLFTQACHAIQHAHQKGVIHRDIKPSNVMITLHDGVPVVKVIDFGIAKATDVELTTRTLFTQHHQMVGTPAYMSPEQAEMSGLDIDTRSDIYSLGVLLYELLTGTTPFATEELVAKGYAEMMRIIREEEPHKPSTRLSSLGASAAQTARRRHTDVARLGTLLRGDLDWIVMRCLEKDRTRRYETAKGLADDIRRHLADEPVEAGPPSATYRVSKFLKRHRVGASAAAVVAVVLVLGIVATTTAMLRANHQRKRADEVKLFIAEMLSGVNPQVARGRDKTLLMGILDDAATRVLEGEIRDELIAAELHHVIGSAYLAIGAWDDEAARHLPVAVEIRTRLLGEDDPSTLESMHELLKLGMFQGSTRGWAPQRRSEQEALALRILQLREQVLGPEHPDTLESLETYGTIIGTFGRLAEVEPIIARTVEARTRVLGPEHRDTLESMAHMGLLQLKLGRLAEAEPLLRDIVDRRAAALGENDPDTLTSVGNLRTLYEVQGRYEEALPLRRRTVAIAEKVLGPEHPYVPTLRSGLGVLCVMLDRHEEAADVFEADVRERRRLHGLKRGTTWTAMRNLGAAYDLSGRRADALALYRDMLELLPESTDDNAPPSFLFTAAWVRTRDHPDVNDPARAVELARTAIERARARGSTGSVHMYLDTLALALHQSGATAEAIETERRAIASTPELTPRPGDPRTGDVVRADYRARLHRYETSLEGQTSPPPDSGAPEA